MTAKHDAELQRLQTEKSELAVRLDEFQKSATATLGQCQAAGTAGDEKESCRKSLPHADETDCRSLRLHKNWRRSRRPQKSRRARPSLRRS